MPDFQLNNMRLTVRARPKLTSSGDMSFEFSSPRLNADIQATGGCNVSGVDVCNKIFGTNRRIQKSVENAALGALNGNQIQNGLAAVLKLYLQSRNITGKIVAVQVAGTDLVITTLSDAPATPPAAKPMPVPGTPLQRR